VGKSSSLIVVKIESAPTESALAAVKELQQIHGIKSLDVVIANAGISKIYPTVADVDVEDMKEHYLVNTIGVVTLFQAVLPLLNNSQKEKKFIAISSSAASIGDIGTRGVSERTVLPTWC
jgi:norsolorinic acid ketoreductase